MTNIVFKKNSRTIFTCTLYDRSYAFLFSHLRTGLFLPVFINSASGRDGVNQILKLSHTRSFGQLSTSVSEIFSIGHTAAVLRPTVFLGGIRTFPS